MKWMLTILHFSLGNKKLHYFKPIRRYNILHFQLNIYDISIRRLGKLFLHFFELFSQKSYPNSNIHTPSPTCPQYPREHNGLVPDCKRNGGQPWNIKLFSMWRGKTTCCHHSKKITVHCALSLDHRIQINSPWGHKLSEFANTKLH
jgi:hypothetical protein